MLRQHFLKRSFSTSEHHYALESLVSSFRRFGYHQAQTDPLGLTTPQHTHPTLQLKHYPILYANPTALLSPSEYLQDGSTTPITISDFHHQLQEIYCKALGAEYQHLTCSTERDFLTRELEMDAGVPTLSKSEKRNAATTLLMAQVFEHFLAKKYPSFKRYSGEGEEAMFPAIDTICRLSALSKVDEIVIGMPHRGRLALLVSMLQYPAVKMFSKIQGNTEFPPEFRGIDDVTSHIAVSTQRQYGNDAVKVSLLHNPSHLEIINPVAQGKIRAKRDAGSDAVGLFLHGDAAFSGQGCVPEAFALSQLPDFTTQGSIHIVVNNQIGFTTTYPDSRSSKYCTDWIKGMDVPVLRVNAEDMEHVIKACKIAHAFRNEYKKDFVIELVGYRRYGHNEVDEPSFTQPTMYEAIQSTSSFPDIYKDKMVEEGIVTEEKMDKLTKTLNEHLEAEYQAAQTYKPTEIDAFKGNWEAITQPSAMQLYEQPKTGKDVTQLVDIGLSSVEIPPDYKVHDRLLRSHINARKHALSQESGAIKVDWATAEAMAFGSLLVEGNNVRLSGQDCRRGTFSQRHCTFVNQSEEKRYTPFEHLDSATGRFHVVNSNLSELAVMGFEYGYSWEDPKNLSIWEAQFGDFNNGAQIIIDQFLASGESKWMRQSGLVLLLPHGYDGAGPDHSSAKLERFLQLCDTPAWVPPTGEPLESFIYDTNMLVANITTPANYFHILRRQQLRNFRKPLVLMSPKTLLRLPEAVSSIEDMGPETCFEPVIGESVSTIDPVAIKRVIFCSGKFYYDLIKKREAVEDFSTVIVRIEELSPFPFNPVLRELEAYPNAEDYVWVQEEPLNQGAWAYVQAHMNHCLHSKGRQLQYIGRESLPASATGLSKESARQMEQVLTTAFPLQN